MDKKPRGRKPKIINQDIDIPKTITVANKSKVTVNKDTGDYDNLKNEWLELCLKIDKLNKESEIVELLKNEIQTKLLMLLDPSYNSSDLFDIISSNKQDNKNHQYSNKILDTDNSESSDSSDDDSDVPKSKVIKKKINHESDSDSENDIKLMQLKKRTSKKIDSDSDSD